MAIGTTLGGSSSRIIYQEGTANATSGTTETDRVNASFETMDATGTAAMSMTVPMEGAELIEATFTVYSTGSVTTSGTQAFGVGDGTNILALVTATSATTTAGTVITLTPQSVNNGVANTAVAAGTRMVFTNTEAGTIGNGMHGLFRLVWSV